MPDLAFACLRKQHDEQSGVSESMERQIKNDASTTTWDDIKHQARQMTLVVMMLFSIQCVVAVSAHAETAQATEKRLFENNFNAFIKRVKKAKNIQIDPANKDPNDNEPEQMRYCHNFVRAIKNKSGAVKQPTPIISTATHGNEFIRKFLYTQESHCNSPVAKLDTYDKLLGDKEHPTFFEIYQNPEVPTGRSLMWMTDSPSTHKKIPNRATVLVFSYSAEVQEKNSCPSYEDSGIEDLMTGVFVFDQKIIAYSIGGTNQYCPKGYHCRSDVEGNRNFFLRLFPLNSGYEIFGDSYVAAVKRGEGYFESWNTNYICSIYFD
jgi:hypothetical protein